MRELAYQAARDGSEFQYLTLPGQDMLDIRFLHDELLGPLQVKLRFLAFDSGADRGSAEDVATNASLHAVMRLPYVDGERSRLRADRIERLASDRSAAHDDLRTFGAFHAINIDLCDGAGNKAGAANNPNMFDVLSVLLEAQSRTEHGCVLLLTTRIDEDQVHPEVRHKLNKMVSQNLDRCAEFAQQMDKHFSQTGLNMTDEAFALLTSEEQFTIGLLKWLCSCAVSHRMSLELKSVMTYKQNPGAKLDDLASIAVMIAPNRDPAPDAAGVAVAVRSLTDDQWECNLSGRFPRVLAKTARVDVIMRENAQKFAECCDETAHLLEAASYDISGYADFAEQSLLSVDV